MTYKKFVKALKELIAAGVVSCKQKYANNNRYIISLAKYSASAEQMFVTSDDFSTEDKTDTAKADATMLRVVPHFCKSTYTKWLKEELKDNYEDCDDAADVLSRAINYMIDSEFGNYSISIADIDSVDQLKSLITTTNANLAKLKQFIAESLLVAQVKML